MNIKFALVGAVMAVAGSLGAAQAATIDLVNQGSTVWGSKNLYQDGVKITKGGSSTNVLAGLFMLKDKVSGTKFETFCIDVYNTLGTPPGKYDTTQTSWFSTKATEAVQKLYNTAYASVSTAVQAAGFQLALWEIVTEDTSKNGFDLSKGFFSATASSAVMNQAKSYLSGLTGKQTGSYDLTFFKSTSTPKGQDLLSATPSAVPVPASVLLLAGGLAGLGGIARRKAKKA
ncbi:VPLPA-CTERM sorting domain-containing protein [Paracoccus sp. TK19116]|uniref:VPLPA-CTERM sorting domain-containing protein n=1 Tax=Paracoccus albicereus TaxID=2922394 RepID=A0ABT1MUW6_9RHOB|nr:VPLPA-CTERM sorting domain-containing protein [Paracoccus albicereus]MCQ0970651.1 VPLPA-CTERM sorting domain-containing protein [Paracoccus albicereus]